MKKKAKKVLKFNVGKTNRKTKIGVRGKNLKRKKNIKKILSKLFYKKPVPKGKISKALWAKIIFAGICFFIAIILTFIIGIYSPLKGSYDFELSRGQTVSNIAHNLKSDGVILSENFFKASVLFFGGRVQAGTYGLQAGASTWQIAKMLARGDIAATTVLIPEGTTIKQIRRILANTKGLTGNTDCNGGYKNSDGDSDFNLCKLQDGDFFPDTYRVVKGTERADVLKLAKKKMDKIRIGWQENSRRFIPDPLTSWNQVVTLASIVQKETPRASEMPVVASVYLNRLKKKMKLQADPTVVYAITNGLGDMQGQFLLLNHLKYKSPYNTYLNYGLPPAPIANVGRDAIFAVLSPADTNYLYFVADGHGGHKFADTYAQHQKNRADWRKIKKAINSK